MNCTGLQWHSLLLNQSAMKSINLKLFGLPLILVSAGLMSWQGKGTLPEITYIRKGAGTISGMGNYLKTFINRRNVKDTATKSTPLNIFLDGVGNNNKGIFFEVCKVLKEGDSVIFSISAENFYKVTQSMTELPSGVAAESPVVIRMGVKSILSIHDHILEQQKKWEEKKLKFESQQDPVTISDGVQIDQYLAAHKLVAKQTKSGVRYVVTFEGRGEAMIPGNNISIHYIGTLLNGTKFDASRDRNAPFIYRYRINQVIYGMDDGFSAANIKAGSKLTLFIPSPLAYGTRQRSEVIKPNSILVFDVEILN
jgi:FKBP-type peptidyl-prolyl cis-trans isomerase FkpA